jgi:hypothetical protein
VRVPVCAFAFSSLEGDFYIKKCVFDVPSATPGLWFFAFFPECIGTSSLSFRINGQWLHFFISLLLENTDFFLSKRPTRAIEYG